MQICPTTGEECAALNALAALDVPRTVTGHPEDQEVYETFKNQSMVRLIDAGQERCTELSCGVVAIGAAVAVQLLSIETAKQQLIDYRNAKEGI